MPFILIFSRFIKEAALYAYKKSFYAFNKNIAEKSLFISNSNAFHK